MKYILALVIVVAGCTSDADKLSMLKSDYAIADLLAQHYQEKYDSLFKYEKDIGGHGIMGPKTRAYADSMHTYTIRRDLAERELNRFMAGR
jgi:hypothetical protein